jgi:predicted permease
VALILETLAPLALLIALGSALAHIRFLGAAFIADLNKLAFWVALPALIFTTADHGTESGTRVWPLFAVMVAATFLISLIAWALSFALRLPGTARGTLVQSAFRGNLAYIGIPVLANSFNIMPGPGARDAMTTVIIVVVLTMALYNVLAVVVLQLSRHSLREMNWARMARSIGTNPLLLSGLLGLMMPLLHLRLPSFLEQALTSLGLASLPIALLCIGGSLVMVPLRGRLAWIVTAAFLKTALLPLLVLPLAHLAGLGPVEQRIALVLAACPTAAAAFIMAAQMGGDEALASGSVALSTVLSGLTLAIALSLAG